MKLNLLAETCCASTGATVPPGLGMSLAGVKRERVALDTHPPTSKRPATAFPADENDNMQVEQMPPMMVQPQQQQPTIRVSPPLTVDWQDDDECRVVGDVSEVSWYR